jgi:hypothetical protein
MLAAFIAMFFQIPHEWRAACANVGVVVGFGSLFMDVSASKFQVLGTELFHERHAVVV